MGIHAPEVIVILNDDEEGTSAFGIVENSDRNVRRRQVLICSRPRLMKVTETNHSHAGRSGHD